MQLTSEKQKGNSTKRESKDNVSWKYLFGAEGESKGNGLEQSYTTTMGDLLSADVEADKDEGGAQ